jgi:hypothetical protein
MTSHRPAHVSFDGFLDEDCGVPVMRARRDVLDGGVPRWICEHHTDRQRVEGTAQLQHLGLQLTQKLLSIALWLDGRWWSTTTKCHHGVLSPSG